MADYTTDFTIRPPDHVLIAQGRHPSDWIAGETPEQTRARHAEEDEAMLAEWYAVMATLPERSYARPDVDF